MKIARVSELLWRVARFFSMLPEHCANSLRFRVFFIRELGFATPAKIRIGTRDIELHLLKEEGVRDDCMECLFHNYYGLGKQLGEVRTIVDVGANVGFFSLAARAHYPRAMVHAYEPNPRVLPLLRANTANFDIQIFPEALGGTSSWVVIDDTSVSNAASTRPSLSDTGISQITLDTALERIGGSVDLLKLDCEGAEWPILTHARNLRAIRNLRMEYHLFDGQSHAQMFDLLSSAGFHVVKVAKQCEENGIIWASRS
jgi:FkbM family methyltransferase